MAISHAAGGFFVGSTAVFIIHKADPVWFRVTIGLSTCSYLVGTLDLNTHRVENTAETPSLDAFSQVS